MTAELRERERKRKERERACMREKDSSEGRGEVLQIQRAPYYCHNFEMAFQAAENGPYSSMLYVGTFELSVPFFLMFSSIIYFMQ